MPDPISTPVRSPVHPRVRAVSAYADGFKLGWRGEPLGELPADPVGLLAYKLGWVDGGTDRKARASGAGSYDEDQLADLIDFGDSRAELAHARQEIATLKARLRQCRDAVAAWEFVTKSG